MELTTEEEMNEAAATVSVDPMVVTETVVAGAEQRVSTDGGLGIDAMQEVLTLPIKVVPRRARIGEQVGHRLGSVWPNSHHLFFAGRLTRKMDRDDLLAHRVHHNSLFQVMLLEPGTWPPFEGASRRSSVPSLCR